MKKNILFYCIGLFISLLPLGGKAQNFANSALHLHNYNNYFILNPAVAGFTGDPFLTLTYSKLLLGSFDQAPTQYMLSFNSPFDLENTQKHFYGANLYSFNRSIWNTTGGWVSYAYEAVLPYSDVNAFRLGIAMGMEADALNINDEQALSDPAIINRLDNRLRPVGQFGMFYIQKNLELGAGLPRLFPLPRVGTEEVSNVLYPFRNWYASMAYNINLANYIWFFKPMLIYKNFENNESYIEANATFNYKNLLYLNAAWFQEAGFAVGAGADIRHGKFKISYVYKFPQNNQASFISNPMHEVQISINLRRQESIDTRLFGFGKEPIDSSLYATDPIEEPQDSTETVIEEPQDTVPEVVPKEIRYRNYVIVGSFLEESNAKKLEQQFKEKYKVTVKTRYNERSNFFNVYIIETDDLSEAEEWEKTSRDKYKIEDVWILRVPIEE